MIVYDWLLIVAVLFLGVITSYTDYFEGKIRNKHLLFSLFILALLVATKFFYDGLRPEVFGVNMLLGAVVSIGLWLLGLWTPGDAKLFIVISAYISAIFNKGFLPLQLMFFVFIPMFVFILFLSAFRLKLKKILKYFKSSLDMKMVYTVFGIFVLTWAFVLGPVFGGLLFVCSLAIMLFLKEKAIYPLLIAAFFRFILDPSVFTPTFWSKFLLLIVAVYFLRFFLGEFFFDVFAKRVNFEKLKPGMVAAERIIKKDGKYQKKPVKGVKKTSSNTIFSPSPEGITKHEIKKLRNMKKELGFCTIKVFETLPFAPFMFFGTVLLLAMLL